MSSLASRILPKLRTLSLREGDALMALHDCCGDVAAAAKVLGISQSATYMHIRRAAAKLGVKGQRAAAEACGFPTDHWIDKRSGSESWAALVGQLEMAFAGEKWLKPEQARAIRRLVQKSRMI